MLFDNYFGEYIELPPELVQLLHERTAAAAVFRPMNLISEAAYSLYEQWKKL